MEFDIELYRRWYLYLVDRWHLDPKFAPYVAAAQTWIQQHGYQPVVITSGYRSPLHQLELQNRWDAGNRVGLRARPATYSWHMQGLAVDVSTRDPSFTAFRTVMLSFDEHIRWGGDFRKSDPIHFDLPIGNRLSIKQLIAQGYH